MPVIGMFKPENDGYVGTIRTLSLNAKVKILAYDRKGSDGMPDFRIFAGDTEIGAAWRKTNKDTGTSYLSLWLDDPAFITPIRASLLEATDDGTHRLLWRRDKRSESRSET